jgi:hypothetical protein
MRCTGVIDHAWPIFWDDVEFKNPIRKELWIFQRGFIPGIPLFEGVPDKGSRPDSDEYGGTLRFGGQGWEEIYI